MARVYPALFFFARKYGVIVATSTPSERTFSVSTRLDPKTRSNMDNNLFDAIIFLHNVQKWRLLHGFSEAQAQYRESTQKRRQWIQPHTLPISAGKRARKETGNPNAALLLSVEFGEESDVG